MALNVPMPDFSNATSLEQKFNILADSYFMLRKELEYALQNLSTENFNSVYANNITAKNVKGGNIEGTTIKGSAIEGGSININNAFIVDGAGNAVMLGTLNIAGKIIVDAAGNMTIYGGQMTWASSDPKIQDIDIELSNINGYLTDVNGQLIEIDGRLVGMNGEISDIYVTANLAGTNIVKLSNGTYLGGTFIDGKRIQAPEIYGGKISGIDILGSYFMGQGENSAYLIIGTRSGNLGDLSFYRGGSSKPLFQIYDNVPGVSLKVLNGSNVEKTILESNGDSCTPKGNWDFSGATVTGIMMRFGS